MTKQDIRWQQRFSNYIKALHKLGQAVNYVNENLKKDEWLYTPAEAFTVMDQIIKEGLIQRFEYTHELAWNVMKDYAAWQGNNNVGGSRDATREAFVLQLIANGDVWMDMISSRNKTSHTYNQETADEIYIKILHDYYPAFRQFEQKMIAKRDGEQGEIQ